MPRKWAVVRFSPKIIVPRKIAEMGAMKVVTVKFVAPMRGSTRYMTWKAKAVASRPMASRAPQPSTVTRCGVPWAKKAMITAEIVAPVRAKVAMTVGSIWL